MKLNLLESALTARFGAVAERLTSVPFAARQAAVIVAMGLGLGLPGQVLASDFSALIPFYIALVLVVAGCLAGFEWMLINAFTDRGEKAEAGDPEARNQSRFGCGLAVGLWAANSILVHLVLYALWA